MTNPAAKSVWHLPRGIWIFCLIGAVAFVVWDTTDRVRHLLDVDKFDRSQSYSPKPDQSSATGYKDGVRSLVVPGLYVDSYHWIMQAQMGISTGEWRVHHVDYDNAPSGRPMHWASPGRWWLTFLAYLDHLLSGRPLGVSVERAALLANPILLLIFLASAVPFVARKFGTAAAAFVAVGSITLRPFYQNFTAGNAEHHGMAECFAFLTVLFILVGLSDSKEKRWFYASAVAGGLGLWISAASQIPILIGVGLASVTYSWICRKTPNSSESYLDPVRWSQWARVGGSVSLAAYLIEYFPSFGGFRLEVNHPVYACAWVGAGEVLTFVGVFLRGGKSGAGRKGLARPALGVLSMALPLLVLLATSGGSFVLSDPFLWRLHTLYIAEFQGARAYFAKQPLVLATVAMWLPFTVVLFQIAYVAFGKRSAAVRGLVAFALVPLIVEMILTASQIRWWGLAAAGLMASLVILGSILEKEAISGRASRSWPLVFVALLFYPGLASAVGSEKNDLVYSREEIFGMAERNIAQWLTQRDGGQPAIVASTPTLTTSIVYHGNLRGLGTLYWENIEGLKRNAALFAASAAGPIPEIREDRLRYIVLASWEPFVEPYVRLNKSLALNQPVRPDAFGPVLLRGMMPPMGLRRLSYRLPQHPVLAGQSVAIFEVVDNESAGQGLAWAADYYIDMGDLETAAKLEPYLTNSSDLTALVALGRIQALRGEGALFPDTIKRVSAELPQAATLSFEEHIHLAELLWMADRADPARAVLTEGFSQMNEANLRQLTTSCLYQFTDLLKALGMEIPDVRLRRLTEELAGPAKS